MKVRNLVIFFLVTAIILVGAFAVFFGISMDRQVFDPMRAISYDKDLAGSAYLIYMFNEEELEDVDVKEAAKQAVEVMKKRLTIKGYSNATVTQYGEKGIRVDVPINKTSPMKDVNQIASWMGATGNITITDNDGNIVLQRDDLERFAAVEGTFDSHSFYIETTDAGQETLKEKTTEILENVDKGDLTSDNNQYLTIKVDGEQVGQVSLTTPMEDKVFGFSIGSDLAQGIELADLLNSGKLPVGISLLDNKEVSGVMGKDGYFDILCMILGAAVLVCLASIVFGRLEGIVASLSIVAYMAITFFLIALLRITTSSYALYGVLAGLLFLVMAMFMFYKQFAKEFRSGKNIKASYKSGYATANNTVNDMFFVLALIALVFIMGSIEAIKTFSYFLGIAVVIAYIVYMVIHRLLLGLVVGSFFEKESFYFSKKQVKGGNEIW